MRQALLALAFCPAFLMAEAIDSANVIKAPITALDIFKNGTVVVTRQVQPKGEDFYLEGDQKPAHGTFWLDSEEPVELTALMETVKTNELTSTDTRSLAERHGGYDAVVWFASDTPGLDETLKLLATPGEKSRTLTVFPPAKPEAASIYKAAGTVVSLRKEKEEGDQDGVKPVNTIPNPVTSYDGVVLSFPNGSCLRVPTAAIRSLCAEGENEVEKTTRRKLWRVKGATAPFSFEYITQGATWAPSYRVELDEHGKAGLTMACDLRNELEDLEDTEVSLVSGYPRIDQAGQDSLLDISVSLQGFLGLVPSPAYAPRAMMKAAGMVSNSAYMEADECACDGAVAGGAAAREQGAVNLHYKPIGKVSVKKGETLRREIATTAMECSRQALWTAYQMRNDEGYVIRGNDPNEEQDVWDTLIFNNPFPFPMTAAPMEVIKDDGLYCQTQQKWLNPGQESRTQLTKALTVSVTQKETEDEAYRAESHIIHVTDSRDRIELLIHGIATIKNFGKEEMPVRIKLSICGKPQTLNAQTALLVSKTTASSGYNPVTTAIYETTLKPGQSEQITYDYKIAAFLR